MALNLSQLLNYFELIVELRLYQIKNSPFEVGFRKMSGAKAGMFQVDGILSPTSSNPNLQKLWVFRESVVRVSWNKRENLSS